MKKLILGLAMLLSVAHSYSSHLFGGYITWQCLNGQYVFQVKVYRDCNGIPQNPVTQINVYGHPSICSIPVNGNLTVVNDITPPCGYNCNNGGAGATQEFIYTTNPCNLPGAPSSLGWVFEINDCCRNTLTNLASTGFSIRSVMYPTVSNNNPCFDSSPFLAEKPNSFACIGYPFSFNLNAVDPDNDSLSYEWANPMDHTTSQPCNAYVPVPLAFTPPYTLQKQLPGSPLLNTQTGQLNLLIPATSGTIGNFATCIKITSYKCKNKISEVFVDCGFTFTTNCLIQGTAPNNNNLPPVFSMISGNSYIDTVSVGDTVNFTLSVTDFQANMNGTSQTILLTASGGYFGTAFTSATGGCPTPPCATLNPPLPISTVFATQTSFKWVTTCEQLSDSNCAYDRQKNIFNFMFAAKDNGCPANLSSTATVSIVLVGPRIYHLQDSMWVSLAGATTFQWFKNGIIIAGATNSYYIAPGPGQYTCSVGSSHGCNSRSLTINPFLGSKEPEAETSLKISPNPSKGFINIQTSRAFKAIQIYDVPGKIVFEEKLQSHSQNLQVNTENLSKGMYIVKALYNNGSVIKKIMVE